MFLSDEIGGLDFDGSRRSDKPGVGPAGWRWQPQERAASPTVRRGVRIVASRPNRPARNVTGGRSAMAVRCGRARRDVRRSCVGNAPGVHGLWPQALALGYRVAVRPSRREPFTGQRLVAALRAEWIRTQDVGVSAHRLRRCRRAIIRAADLAMVYRRPGRRRQVPHRSDGLGQRTRAARRYWSPPKRTGTSASI